MTGSVIPVLQTIAPPFHWVAVFAAAVTTLFALYVGVALIATLMSKNVDIAKIRYQVLCELLKIFRRGPR
jgi:hypothetical protein